MIPLAEGLSSVRQKFFPIVAKSCAARELRLVPGQESSERGPGILPASALACGRAARAPRGGTRGIEAEPRGERVPRQEPGKERNEFLHRLFAAQGTSRVAGNHVQAGKTVGRVPLATVQRDHRAVAGEHGGQGVRSIGGSQVASGVMTPRLCGVVSWWAV
jgi:hypothetical protein